MTDEDTGSLWSSWPEGFRRVLDRLERYRSLPPADAPAGSLGPGVAPRLREPEIVGPREPVEDVTVGPRSIFVTVELPGVDGWDIELAATGSSLVVSASSPLRKYYREIPLPRPVRTDTIRATYRNEVLDVVLEIDDGARRVPLKGGGR